MQPDLQPEQVLNVHLPCRHGGDGKQADRRQAQDHAAHPRHRLVEAAERIQQNLLAIVCHLSERKPRQDPNSTTEGMRLFDSARKRFEGM